MNNEPATKYIKDEGIVLASKDIGEADKILTIYTLNFGKLEVLGKNVKKLTSRRASACDILTYSKFAIGNGKFETLAEAVNLDQFPKIKANLVKLAFAFLAIESLNLITPVAAPNPEFFSNLLSFLRKLTEAVNTYETKVALASFQVKLLVGAGWLGKDFQVKQFSNLGKLQEFLIYRFEEIGQKRLKSVEFAKMVLGLL